ncbi:putative aminoacyl-tRNA synthetase, class Ic [Helianthus annuus]|nr:putative aminoacyl-tRNA synthetase, class Ic [Helianthus annuus]
MLKGGYENKCADMLPGLKEGQDKMSKSDTSSTIFMEDEEVISKISNVYCPPKVIDKNLCLEYVKTLHSSV